MRFPFSEDFLKARVQSQIAEAPDGKFLEDPHVVLVFLGPRVAFPGGWWCFFIVMEVLKGEAQGVHHQLGHSEGVKVPVIDGIIRKIAQMRQ